jgi:hypothetical protein
MKQELTFLLIWRGSEFIRLPYPYRFSELPFRYHTACLTFLINFRDFFLKRENFCDLNAPVLPLKCLLTLTVFRQFNNKNLD